MFNKFKSLGRWIYSCKGRESDNKALHFSYLKVTGNHIMRVLKISYISYLILKIDLIMAQNDKNTMEKTLK